MDVFEFLLAVFTTLLFIWWLGRTLYLAMRTGVMLMLRPPHFAVRKVNPVAFWFVGFVYVFLIGLSLFMLFVLVVVPFVH